MWSADIDGPVQSIDFSPTDHWTAVGFANGDVQAIDSNGKVVWENNVGPAVLQVRILPLKKRIVVLNEYSQLQAFDYSGKEVFNKGFKSYWTSFEIQSGKIILWGWKSPPLKLNSNGKIIKKLPIPHPWRRLKAAARKGRFWVVHNEVCLGLYDSDGTNLWLVNNPANIDLSRTHPSDIELDDSGSVLAVACQDRGVYLYNGESQTLKHIDLDKNVMHVAVSGDGKVLLITDPFNHVWMVSNEAHVLWEMDLDSSIEFCRIDQKGARILLYENNGTLSCYKFLQGTEQRAEFLELTDFAEVSDKKEVWQVPSPRSGGRGGGTVQISANGQYVVHGAGKRFQVFDFSGKSIWMKTFMTTFENVFVTQGGHKVFLSNASEVFILDTETLQESRVDFYGSGIQRLGIDPDGTCFLVHEKGGALKMFSGKGKLLWSGSISKDIHKLQIHHKSRCAVFRGAPKTVYALNLKNGGVNHTVLGGPITCLQMTPDGIYVGGAMGRCHALDFNCKVQWKFQVSGPIRDIIPLKKWIAFRSDQGNIYFCNRQGELQGEYQLHHSRSVLTQVEKDILEIAPGRESISCYKVLTGERVWKQRMTGAIQSIAVSASSNRMAILDSKFIRYYQLIHDPAQPEARGSYLEF